MYRFLDQDLGRQLVREQSMTQRQLDEAIESRRLTGEPLPKVLLSMGHVSEKDILRTIGKLIGVEYVDLDSRVLDPEMSRTIPEHLARHYKVIPVALHNHKLMLAMVDPLNVIAIDDLRLLTGRDVEPVIAGEESILKAINNQFGGHGPD